MHIATPCHENWNRMTPVVGGRHCASCDQQVVDLTDLATAERREKLAVIARTVAGGKRVCVRGRIDRDGALSGTHRLLTGGMAALLAMSIAGCYGEDQAVTQPAPVPTTTAPSTMQGSPVPTPPPAQPVRMGDFAEPPAVLKGKVAAVPPTMGEACVKPAPPVAPAPPAPQNAVAVPRQDR